MSSTVAPAISAVTGMAIPAAATTAAPDRTPRRIAIQPTGRKLG